MIWMSVHPCQEQYKNCPSQKQCFDVCPRHSLFPGRHFPLTLCQLLAVLWPLIPTSRSMLLDCLPPWVSYTVCSFLIECVFPFTYMHIQSCCSRKTTLKSELTLGEGNKWLWLCFKQMDSLDNWWLNNSIFVYKMSIYTQLLARHHIPDHRAVPWLVIHCVHFMTVHH